MLQKISDIRVPNILRHKSIYSVQDIKVRTSTGPDFVGMVKTTIYQLDCLHPKVHVTTENSNIVVKICLSAQMFDIVKKLRLLKISGDNKSYKSTSTVVENVEKLESGIEAMDVVNKVVSTDKKLSFNIRVTDGWFLSNNREHYPLNRGTATYVTDNSVLPFFAMFHHTIGSELLGTFSDRFEKLIKKRINFFTDLYNRASATSSDITQNCLLNERVNIDEVGAISRMITALGNDTALRSVIEKRNSDCKIASYFSLYSFGVKIEDFTKTYSSVCKGSISETTHRIKKIPSNFLEAANNYFGLSLYDRPKLADKFIDVLILIEKKMDEYKEYIDENNVSEFKTTLAFIEQVLNK